MRVDERCEVEGGERAPDGRLLLTVRAKTDFVAEAVVLELLVLDFDELLDTLGLDADRRVAFREPRRRLIFSNGWQSWSFGGELAEGERISPAILIGALNTYVFRPGPREGRDEILSHHLVHVRGGDWRIVLVSLGVGKDRSGAPVAFRVDRKTLAVRVEVHAGGTAYRAGDVVARLACAVVEGFFAERDFLRSLFAGDGRFDRLSFLGTGGALVPGGYESWYNHYTAIDAKVIASDLDALDSNANLINSYYIRRGKPTVFQIDDGWETALGDWSPHAAKFPDGLTGLARRIEEKGLIPGLWVAPFIVEQGSAAAAEHAAWLLRDRGGRPVVAGWNPNWSGDFWAWDLSVPEVGDWLASLFERIVEEWGYRYLKLDFLYAGLLEGERREGGAAWEHYERVVSRITSRLSTRDGRPVAWLGCGAPLEASYRHFPLMRIGADTKEVWDDWQARLVRHQGRPSAKVNLLHTLGRALLDGAVFINDPDVVFCRSKGMAYDETEKELIASVARMFASQIMFSDDAADFGDSAELEFTKRIVAIYDRIEGMEFGALRIGRDLFEVIERDDRIRGWINLGDRSVEVPDPHGAETAPRDDVLPFHASRTHRGWRLERRSMSLLAR